MLTMGVINFMDRTIKFKNGVEIPVLGFGTYKMENGSETFDSVSYALEVGYRHIDTAKIYENEESVGEAIKNSSIKREDIFVTTKVWNTDRGYDNTLRAFEESMKKLKLDYLDLYLIHWPKDLNAETWKALEKLYNEKRVRAVGVSNFNKHHLEELFKTCEVFPMINQIELHPELTQKSLYEFCNSKDIVIEAWSPLIRGKILSIDLLKELSKSYNKTIAQIVLRWNVQLGIVTIPKSSNKDRIKENFDIFDFELSKEDMEKISSLNKNFRTGPDPDNIDF